MLANHGWMSTTVATHWHSGRLSDTVSKALDFVGAGPPLHNLDIALWKLTAL